MNTILIGVFFCIVVVLVIVFSIKFFVEKNKSDLSNTTNTPGSVITIPEPVPNPVTVPDSTLMPAETVPVDTSAPINIPQETTVPIETIVPTETTTTEIVVLDSSIVPTETTVVV